MLKLPTSNVVFGKQKQALSFKIGPLGKADEDKPSVFRTCITRKVFSVDIYNGMHPCTRTHTHSFYLQTPSQPPRVTDGSVVTSCRI